MSAILHIRDINDLGKYLGIPLLYKKQTTTVFQGLIERMKNRVQKWQHNKIALAGLVLFEARKERKCDELINECFFVANIL